MALSTGTKLGAYEIVEPIGKGGMGEVYRARDTTLDRDVAIKVLPEELAADDERVARFEREAKLLASLNHPNIASIYGFEGSPQPERSAQRSGVAERDVVGVGRRDTNRCALVLELVEGPTLAERIAEGPIPVEEALAIAKQIATALDAGHEAGVVHRDLKPANVKLKSGATVKVLDYGLAKALEGDAPEGADSGLSHSPTMTRQGTAVGMILGTAAYMSPEQARGLPVDKRTDIFSFGSVLFEMLSGRRAFGGELVSDALASVIKSEPDWSALPPGLSPRLRELLKRCLEKDPSQRRRDIGDVRVELERIASGDDGSAEQGLASTTRAPVWRRLLPVATLVAGIVLGVTVWRPPETAKPTMRFELPLPGGVRLAHGDRNVVALSPDGKRLAHTASTGNDYLYLREMEALTSAPIEETVGFFVSGPRNPIFSPDGAWLLFWASGKLKKVAVSGGSPVTVCDAELPDGASWSEDDVIVYSTGNRIWRVSANGGEPELLVALEDGERAHRPQLLTGGGAIVYTFAAQDGDAAEVVVQSLPDGERRALFEGASAHYVPSGHLVYALENTLFAIAFDADKLAVSGGPVPILDGVARGRSFVAHFTVADAGTLAYVPGSGRLSSELVWRGSSSQNAVTAREGAYQNVRLSPDGNRLAAQIEDREGPDIWIHDVERDTATRLTTGGRSVRPVWSPDGKWVAFYSRESPEDPPGVFRRASDFSAEAELVFESSDPVMLDDWSPDARWLVFSTGGEVSSRDVWAFDLEERGELRRVVDTSFIDTTASISPDGRFLLYHSTESGVFEIFVTSFPEAGRRIQVSTDGGTDGVWSPDGRRIVYTESGSGIFYEVDVTTSPELRASAPREIFRANYPESFGRGYDVHPDGERFIVASSRSGTEDSIVVVVNWLDELKRLVPVE